jgi:hypothetical protein
MVDAALTMAIAGEEAKAQTLAREVGKRRPEDTLVQSLRIPEVQAVIAINHASPAQAIESLKMAAPFELAFKAEFSPVFIRGQAFLRARQGKEAATEFQKILDHRNIDPVSPICSLAYLGLARANSIAGDTANSRRAYQDFLTLWKDADPDLPILQEAKKEYANLK